MPTCNKHGEFYQKFCHSCNQELIAEVKACAKAEKASGKKKKGWAGFKKSTGKSERQKLKDKLQNLVAADLKKRFKGTDLWYCWISGRTSIRTGLFGLHCAHFYAKGSIWQLANDPHNVFPCTYKENVINPSTVTGARAMMIKVYGEEAILELDRKAEYYLDAMNKGIENKSPKDIQLIAMIEETKKIKI